ncbi:uncharacterized protein LOC143430838 [Xylocopa sonorina]|uniref:uncharacterized protein LOC143430838 n=1 Tax=Xylocopa sonorina TaxID=1818115 RepID=UPI00403B255E
MLWRRILCIVVLGLFSGELVSCELAISSLINACRPSDPSNCVKDIVNGLKPYLKDGVPALQIPPLEPFALKDLEYNQTGRVTIYMKGNNVFLNGVTNFELLEVRFDPGTNILQMQFFFPRLDLTANYEMTGRIYFMSFRGNDRLEGTCTNIEANISTKLNYIQDQTTGVVYWRLDDTRVALNIGHANMRINNIKPKVISFTVNNLLKLRWKTLVQNAMPQLEQNIALLIDNIVNTILFKFSKNELLLD